MTALSTRIQPIFLLADSRLLFRTDGAPSCVDHIRRAATTPEPKAAYIGACNGDELAYYAIFEAAMDGIDIRDRRQIASEYRAADEAFLRAADVIVIAGGDPAPGWRIMQDTGMAQVVGERYADGAVIGGVSAGAVLLGRQGWCGQGGGPHEVFEALKLVPWIVDAHDEANGWSRLKRLVADAGPMTAGLGLPAGSAVIYHADLSLEPVRQPAVEFTLKCGEVVQTLLWPPNGAR